MRRIITAWELESRTEEELFGLLRTISQDLTKSDAGTAERRNALASLENIRRAINARQARSFRPPGC